MVSERPAEVEPKIARVEQINSVLAKHDLVPHYSLADLGDRTKGEIELERAGEVFHCGDGLHLVEIYTRLPNDAEAKFITFFRERESLTVQNLLVPFIKDAPGNLEMPDDVASADETLGAINQQLAQFNLRRLPTIVNSTTENIVGINRIIDVNSRFFTVVVFQVKDSEGNIIEKPLTFNANSASGIDGAVFAVICRTPQYGKEPRFVIGRAYRPNLGGWVTETSRGFYSPRKGGGGPEIRTNVINVPAIKRALDELSDETGIREVDAMHRMGRLKQDPSTDYIYPDIWRVDVETSEFEEQDLEASERIKLDFLSFGDYFAAIKEIEDPFTLAALTKALVSRGQLRISRKGRDAQEKMVYVDKFRFQYGHHMTEFLRGEQNSLPLESDLGQIAVNSGVARIVSGIYSGDMTWGAFKGQADQKDLQRVKLLHPFEAFEAIEQGKIDDVLTITATIKVLHARGYLELTNLR